MKPIIYIISIFILSLVAQYVYAQASLDFYKKNNNAATFSIPIGQYEVKIKTNNGQTLKGIILFGKSSKLIVRTEKGKAAKKEIQAKIDKLLTDGVIATAAQIDSVHFFENSKAVTLNKSDVRKIIIAAEYIEKRRLFNNIMGKVLATTLVALPLSAILSMGQAPMVYLSIGGLLVVEGVIYTANGSKRLNLKRTWVMK